MKTNRRKPFILATLALGLVLVMGLGANTFAKYVTGDNGSDSARVAKFNYVVEVDLGEDVLFNEVYNNKLAVDDGAVNFDVKSSSDNLVAPGTTGSVDFSISGCSEVEVYFDFDATVVGPQLKQADAVIYEPIKWSLEKDGAPVLAATDLTAEAMQTYLEELSKTIEPSDTEDAICGDYTLSWDWAFEADDTNDTILGRLAAGETVTGYTAVNAGVFTISMNITVTQTQNTNN